METILTKETAPLLQFFLTVQFPHYEEPENGKREKAVYSNKHCYSGTIFHLIRHVVLSITSSRDPYLKTTQSVSTCWISGSHSGTVSGL